MNHPKRHRDWILPVAIGLITLPALADRRAALAYCLISGFIFAIELSIAARLARWNSEYLRTARGILCTMILWTVMLGGLAEGVSGWLAGHLEVPFLLIMVLPTALILGVVFARFTGDTHTGVCIGFVTGAAGAFALLDLPRLLGLAVILWHTAIAAWLMRWVRTQRALDEVTRGLCPRCSYDLRDLPLDPEGRVVCPECGSKLPG